MVFGINFWSKILTFWNVNIINIVKKISFIGFKLNIKLNKKWFEVFEILVFSYMFAFE
jgi:hypothetical protein